MHSRHKCIRFVPALEIPHHTNAPIPMAFETEIRAYVARYPRGFVSYASAQPCFLLLV